MKQQIYALVSDVLGILAKVFISLLIIYGIYCLIELTTTIQFILNNPVTNSLNLHTPGHVPTSRSFTSTDVPWPHFPGSSGAIVKKMNIDGVQTISEEWKSTATSYEILTYYREQMLARGWQDMTEKTYGLSPDGRNHDMGQNGLQDQKYIELYHRIMDSNLMLNRGDWSIHVMTKPNEDDMGHVAVQIYAAATPSIKEFSENLAARISSESDQSQASQPIDAVEESGGQKYHTTIASKNETPVQAFQEALANLGTQGWQPVIFLPKQQTQTRYFAWLVRGKDYAALSVRALPQGQSSSVTLVEVTPETAIKK